jgi:hypothetical protein
MTTLHIEHAITDYATWKGAFDRFAEARLRAGVRGHRVRRPVDDPGYLYIDLDFGTEEQAAAFLGFLRTQVWASPASAPALVGAPQTRILTTVDESSLYISRREPITVANQINRPVSTTETPSAGR